MEPTTTETGAQSPLNTYIDELMDTCESIAQRHREENADLYALIERQRELPCKREIIASLEKQQAEKTSVKPPEPAPAPLLGTTLLRGQVLRDKIRASYRTIREALPADSVIVPRTAAHNRKSAHETIDEERHYREEILAAQLQTWRSILPDLIRKFARIPDPRRTTHITHSTTVLMMFGLFAFIFKLASRREMNRELTGPVIMSHLKKLFPEIKTIPHADTLERFLENTSPIEIEKIHIDLIRNLIRNKKFKRLLIQGCLPITIDGSQKLYRDGLLQDPDWCERKVGKPEDNNKQQYIYVLEANITLANGLNIPLLSECLTRSNNIIDQEDNKQDAETTAFERLAKRLKSYFPRLKIILFGDAMFATQTIMGILHDYHWEYIFALAKKQHTALADTLKLNQSDRISLPGQDYYRERKQSFYWENGITYGYEWQLKINLLACLETYNDVDKKTGKIIHCASEKYWISSIPAVAENIHELLNLGARKKGLIEDSFNTEKNRGYHYKHAFSYHWKAMQGFHLLMRLAHAINAISEFTKTIKRAMKTGGCSAILKLIKETLFHPWLSMQWLEEQKSVPPQLRLQME